jgi:SAM-dependent methyltransferase
MASKLNDDVRKFWERGPVGTDARITGDLAPRSAEWFAQVEENRYAREPFIHAVAQFTRHRDARLLEIGVGAGSDHLQWARAGCICHGVDLTDAAIEATRAHLALHGLASDLRRVDAEILPFADASFDVVWSWGVIHHSERPERIIAEIHRVLRPGGVFLGMFYNRRSLAVFAEWLKHAAFAGRPWRSFADVLWHHFESAGTKAYTARELDALFAAFVRSDIVTYMTPYDLQHWPPSLARWFPQHWGMFSAIRAVK